MDTRRLLQGPTMLLVTTVLLVIYIYGYVEQIGENTRSVSVYSSISEGPR